MKRFISFSACFLLLLSGSVSCIEDTAGDGVENRVYVGSEVPQFTVEPPEGADWPAFSSPEDFGGRRAAVVLFSPGCWQCREALPTIEAVWNELIRDNQEEYCLVNISRQMSAESAELWGKEGFDMPYYLDPDRSVFELFANSTVPRIYLIGTGGTVQYMTVEEYEFTAEWLKDKLTNLK